MEEVREVLWGQGVGFVGEKEAFICDAGLNWKPVKVDEGWGDVLPGLGVCEDPGGRVSDILEPVQSSAGDPREDPITVVQIGGNKIMYEDFCHGVRE